MDQLLSTSVDPHPSPTGAGHELSAHVGALVARPPLFVPADATVAEAARIMRAARTSSALVDDGTLAILTSGDLRNRVLAEERPASTAVREVATRPVVALPADAPVYAALLLMLNGGFEHVPVTQDGDVVGVVTHMDMLRHQARTPLLGLGRLLAIDRLDELSQYTDEVADTAAALIADGVEPLRVARVITSLNDALARRLLTLAEERIGPPPCPYVWLALGSQGRGEQVLLSDQDSALAYASAVPGAADYFARLADLVVGGLLAAGIPPCPGGYMATTWCHPLADWVTRITSWVDLPEPQALLEAEIFLDYRPVHGALDLEPMAAALRRGTTSPPFLLQLARTATKFEPPLGPFGRVRSRDGYLDVKKGGIAAVVLLARFYGLAAGSPARSTVDRLAAGAGQGLLSTAGARVLTDTFGFLMGLRLRTQLAARETASSAGGDVEGSPDVAIAVVDTMGVGIAAARSTATSAAPASPGDDDRVNLDDLSWLEHRRLRDSLRTVAETQQATTLRFLTD